MKDRLIQGLVWAHEKRIDLVAGSALLVAAALPGVACGGSAKATEQNGSGNAVAGAKVENPTQNTQNVVPTATEAPRVVRTILDQPIVPVTIDSLKSMANGLYASNVKAFTDSDGSIYSKRTLDSSVEQCQFGNPNEPDNAAFMPKYRLSACAGIVRKMVALNKRNNVDGLVDIAIAARNYFISQYPGMKVDIDSYLLQAGVK